MRTTEGRHSSSTSRPTSVRSSARSANVLLGSAGGCCATSANLRVPLSSSPRLELVCQAELPAVAWQRADLAVFCQRARYTSGMGLFAQPSAKSRLERRHLSNLWLARNIGFKVPYSIEANLDLSIEHSNPFRGGQMLMQEQSWVGRCSSIEIDAEVCVYHLSKCVFMRELMCES